MPQIVPKPNKAASRQEVLHYILAHCDADIQASFLPHGFTLEPLLIQIVREIHKLRTGVKDEAFDATIDAKLRQLSGSLEPQSTVNVTENDPSL